jgi:hypothetical protein
MLLPKVEVPAPEDAVVGIEDLPPFLEREQLRQVQHRVDLLQVSNPVLHVLLHTLIVHLFDHGKLVNRL